MEIPPATRFYGKYRGAVINNIDPQGVGRLLVQVSDVSGIGISSWAMPCFPYTGRKSGWYAVPQIGAGVWVEFEAGNPDYPIWTGCWYGASSELPAAASAAPPILPSVVIASQAFNVIELNDVPGTGGIILKCRSGAKIEITDLGITIDNGKGAKIEMLGPQVSINSGALAII
jgi:uncharacterized protein involved in type VI secretion and phage assembly